MVYVERIVKAGAAIALLLFMAASASAAWQQQYEHTFEQDVSGNGYAMVHQNVNTPTLELQNYMHGSGSVDVATLISSNESVNKYYPQDVDTQVYLPAEYAYSGNISFLEQNEMVYSPVTMAYGTGYYAEHPITYNSKLKERTWGKSYQEGVSMQHQIEYASAFNKDIGVDLECKEPVPTTGTKYSTSPESGVGLARMRIEEEVTEGVVHISELAADTDEDGDFTEDHAWKNPKIEIDENYVGTFTITKNMEFCATKYAKKVRPDWLSCCIGGYETIEDDDKIWDESKVFSCEC